MRDGGDPNEPPTNAVAVVDLAPGQVVVDGMFAPPWWVHLVWAPIGLALKSAAGDLDRGPASERVVVLVSDGEDNCSPPDVPPCQVVQGLRRGGVSVRVESVGVALQDEPAAQRALRCVAEPCSEPMQWGVLNART